VMMLLSKPNYAATTVNTAVETAQVAPTILQALGIAPTKLKAVKLEGTAVLPGTPLK